MKANMQVYIRVCFVIRVAEKLLRRPPLGSGGATAPRNGAFSGRRGAFCLNVHQLHSRLWSRYPSPTLLLVMVGGATTVTAATAAMASIVIMASRKPSSQ